MQTNLQPLRRVRAIVARALHSTPPKPVASEDTRKPKTVEKEA